MSPRSVPGFAPPDPAIERDIRARLEQVETALEKAVRADSDLLAETSQYLLAAGGKRFRPMLVLLSGYLGDPTDPRLDQRIGTRRGAPMVAAGLERQVDRCASRPLASLSQFTIEIEDANGCRLKQWLQPLRAQPGASQPSDRR